MNRQQRFLSIREKFANLLEYINNSYKYIEHYREIFNIYIAEYDENDDTILNQLLFMLSVIYTEKTKTRYHSNDKIAAKIEEQIFAEGIEILKEVQYKDEKILEINEIITKKIDESNLSIYEKTFGYIVTTSHDEIIDITNENVEDVYTNFHNIKRLLEPTERFNIKHKQIDDYLFSLYYFNKIQQQLIKYNNN
jgi:hypothetical protein